MRLLDVRSPVPPSRPLFRITLIKNCHKLSRPDTKGRGRKGKKNEDLMVKNFSFS